jgi:ECF sigma factor
MPEIAKVTKSSLATAERHWTCARTWLYAELKDGGRPLITEDRF